jgi:hypothetical protein
MILLIDLLLQFLHYVAMLGNVARKASYFYNSSPKTVSHVRRRRGKMLLNAKDYKE